MSDMNKELPSESAQQADGAKVSPEATPETVEVADGASVQSPIQEEAQHGSSESEQTIVPAIVPAVVEQPVAVNGVKFLSQGSVPAERDMTSRMEAVDLKEQDRLARQQMAQMTRRSFLWAGVAVATAFGAWWKLDHSSSIDSLKAPLRHALEFDEKVGKALFANTRLAPTFKRELAQEPKPNGTYGLSGDLDVDAWRLVVEGIHGRTEPLELTLAEVTALPRFEMVTEHKCIEGWNTIVHWAGVRFQDFAAKYLPATRNGGQPDIHGKPDDLVPYVAILTPDENYYVGLDMESALHPQTMLCTEMNGVPLTPEHGAPLRLVIPVKYGIKAIKRIGKITYTSERPKDYWAEQGYDWYAGH